MSDFKINVAAPFPSLLVTLEANGFPVNLSGAAVGIYVGKHGKRFLTNATCVVVNGVEGLVRYDFATTDITEEGFYEVQFAVAFPPGLNAASTQYFPTEPYIMEAVQI